MKLELNDIQGIVVNGYSQHDEARFLMLQIGEVSSARQWLSTLVDSDSITHGFEAREQQESLNIAFTYNGLIKLGLDQEEAKAFAYEFQEGLCTKHRMRILGDQGSSAPESWDWGGPDNQSIDMILLIYGKNETAILKLEDQHIHALNRAEIKIVHTLKGLTLEGRKEHFGYRDGISQPQIKGYRKKTPKGNTIEAGEFLFGYKNEYQQYPNTVQIDPAHDLHDILTKNVYNTSKKDFNRNGTYLVFRQLKQDVEGFWKYMLKQANGDYNRSIGLASKMVGRWPSGAPLVKHPNVDPKEDPADVHSASNEDRFGYMNNGDGYGFKCPIGSHLRRTNPRDAADNLKPKESIAVSKTHRIIRRGRAYGKWQIDPTLPDFNMEKIPQEEVGLHFLCFNVNIRRQFEFIQQTWINNRKFSGLNNDPDPITGDPDPEGKGLKADFTIQKPVLRKRLVGIPRFVDVKGGAYFFMPGLKAIKFLSALETLE